jgi:hypothetical protein
MTKHEEEQHGTGGEVETRDDARAGDRGPETTTDAGERATSLSPDLAFKLLSSSRRRDLIRCLDGLDATVDLRELSEQVAAVENGTSPSSLAYDQRKRVYVSLRQTHLPKLSNAGIVDYDPDRSTITPGDGVRALRLLLDTVEEAVNE